MSILRRFTSWMAAPLNFDIYIHMLAFSFALRMRGDLHFFGCSFPLPDQIFFINDGIFRDWPLIH